MLPTFGSFFFFPPSQVNPGQYGLVAVSSSEGRNLPYGHLEDVLSRESAALNCHTNDDKNAWFAIDLGVWILPSSYTLRSVARTRMKAAAYGRGLSDTIYEQGKKGERKNLKRKGRINE